MSAALAAWVAHGVFWGLLGYGLLLGELTLRRVGIFVSLWFGGLVVLSVVPYSPARAMFPSFVAVLDVALVLMIFKSDVRLT